MDSSSLAAPELFDAVISFGIIFTGIFIRPYFIILADLFIENLTRSLRNAFALNGNSDHFVRLDYLYIKLLTLEKFTLERISFLLTELFLAMNS